MKAAGAAGLFNLIPAKTLWGASAPSNQLTRALIGFGSIAGSYNHLSYTGSRLVGLCDPFEYRVRRGLAAADKAGWGKVKGYKNFIELLADPGVDIVHICTPPHWHAVQCVMAANAGKDIWNEKPMTRTVGEGVRVVEAVAAKKRIFRLNTWFRFKDTFYGFGTTIEPVKKLLSSSLPGKGPRTVVMGEGQGVGWKFFWSGRVNAAPQSVPKGFDYEMWLGPAPWKPYTEHRVGTSFRGYWDYDSGGLGDMAQHYLDPVQYLLDKDDTSPVRIEYEGPRQHPECVGRFDRITLVYADGDKVILDGNNSLAGEPFVSTPSGFSIYPKPEGGKTLRIKDANGFWDESKTLATIESLPAPAPQQTDFAQSVRERKTFALNERNGFRSSTMFNLGIVAMRLGRGFDFDPVGLHAVNDPAAERFLYQPMREPWATEFMKG